MIIFFKRYGFFGSFKLMVSLIFTKIFYPKARLIRLPFDIRNQRLIKIGAEFTCGFGCRIEAHPKENEKGAIIEFGENVQINDYVHIGAIESIIIGNNVLMASKIYITDHNHGSYTEEDSDHPNSIPKDRKCTGYPVVIEDNVWLGESVCVLGGVTIGKGSIIGALSVVSKSIPAYSIAVGSPAKVIKTFNFETNKWERIKS
jgi:acetyltransferase-like isoleucine patch superfamily enzyme